MAEFNQATYIESVKATLIEFIKSVVSDIDTAIAFPDISGEGFSLTKPLVYVEFERELNIDARRGRNNGSGTKTKRKLLTFAIQVITTGNNAAILSRDRVVQKIVLETMKKDTFLSGKGIRKAESKYTGSFRVREGIHLARLEFYCEIKFVN